MTLRTAKNCLRECSMKAVPRMRSTRETSRTKWTLYFRRYSTVSICPPSSPYFSEHILFTEMQIEEHVWKLKCRVRDSIESRMDDLEKKLERKNLKAKCRAQYTNEIAHLQVEWDNVKGIEGTVEAFVEKQYATEIGDY